MLVTLGQFGAMTAKAIGAHSHMHKTKVSRAVALLERRKLSLAAPTALICAKRFSRSRLPVGMFTVSWLQLRSTLRVTFWKRSMPLRAALDRALIKLTERSAELAPPTSHIANGRRPG